MSYRSKYGSDLWDSTFLYCCNCKETTKARPASLQSHLDFGCLDPLSLELLRSNKDSSVKNPKKILPNDLCSCWCIWSVIVRQNNVFNRYIDFCLVSSREDYRAPILVLQVTSVFIFCCCQLTVPNLFTHPLNGGLPLWYLLHSSLIWDLTASIKSKV